MKEKKEEKKNNKKKKKCIKFLLGAGVAIVGIWAANKYVPGFNKKIIKPVIEFANKTASDVKESLLKEDKTDTQQIQKKDQGYRKNGRSFVKESFQIDGQQQNRNDFNKMNRCGNRQHRFDNNKKKNFN